MKILFGIITAATLLVSCSTGHVTSYPPYERPRAQQSFYYYPSANVYYDGSCSRYIYNNHGAWVTASILPQGLYIGNDRVQVFYNGPEVWRDNDRHRSTYYRQPVVVRDDRYDDRRDHDKRWKRERRREERGRDRD